jgi:hypothetical protein
MRASSIVGSAAALLGLAFLIAASVGTPALAAMVNKAKSFLCSSSAACVTASNTGAGNGVSATSVSSNGVQGNTSSAAASGVYGEADNSAGGAGVAGRTVNGTDDNSEAVLADGGAHGGLALLLVQSGGTLAHTIVARNLDTRTNTLVLDNQGNLQISGLLTQGGSCSGKCAGARQGALSYGTTARAPTIEDTGEARLRNGEVQVALDPAFSDAIDHRAGYVVLLTPEGDTSGLYVAARSSNGFAVRETGNGRSSVPFAYRIVAHPYVVRSGRRPTVPQQQDVAR